jgi:hypothetical protein
MTNSLPERVLSRILTGISRILTGRNIISGRDHKMNGKKAKQLKRLAKSELLFNHPPEVEIPGEKRVSKQFIYRNLKKSYMKYNIKDIDIDKITSKRVKNAND